MYFIAEDRTASRLTLSSAALAKAEKSAEQMKILDCILVMIDVIWVGWTDWKRANEGNLQ